MKKPFKKRILSVTIKHMTDENPETSWIGKYTDDIRPDAIIRNTGEFCGKIDQRRRLLDTLDERIQELEDEKDEPDEILSGLIAKCKARQKRIENSGDIEFPSKGREYRFFLPYAGGEKYPSRDYKKYGLQDLELQKGLERGDWFFMGVSVEARIQLTGDLVQKISSGGLWGIESNAGEEHLTQVEGEERNQLRDELKAIGFTDRQITKAFINCERKDV